MCLRIATQRGGRKRLEAHPERAATRRLTPRSQAVALDWLQGGSRVVAATLIETVGSAPLDPGAEMLVDDAGRIEGSVTGGCVEGALVEEAEAILAGGDAHVVSYGISDHEAADVGLMCGGIVRLFVHELGEGVDEVLTAVRGALEETGRSHWPRCWTGPAPARSWR